jgi:hypothetical protein
MSEAVIAHKVPIHITAEPETALSEANKVEAATTFSVTDTTEYEEEKFLNSEGYSEHTPVWNALTGNIAGKRRAESATQAVMVAAYKNKTPFYIHVLENPTASAGSKGKRYKVFIESDAKDFEAGTSLTFDFPLKFSGAPVAI